MMQIALSFTPGLTSEFKTLRQATQAAVLRTRGGISAIAPEVDMSPSQLGRKLQGNDDDPHRTLDVDAWEKVVGELVGQGDFTPIFWLLEKYNLSAEQQKNAALAQIPALMARLQQALADAEAPRKVRR